MLHLRTIPRSILTAIQKKFGGSGTADSYAQSSNLKRRSKSLAQRLRRAAAGRLPRLPGDGGKRRLPLGGVNRRVPNAGVMRLDGRGVVPVAVRIGCEPEVDVRIGCEPVVVARK